MLDALKRLISGKPDGPDWRAVADWARENKMVFKRVREEEGFVIDGGMDSKPWRLEWGAPQRFYIEGHELRLRMELGLPPQLQLLLLSQPLRETLERQTFERFTESTQTVIDGTTPEEMRWLAMFNKVTFAASKNVRMRFGLVGNSAPVASSWVEGSLAKQLEDAAGNLLQAEPPFVLMLLRGRVYLRMQLAVPDLDAVRQAVGVFEVAVLQAVRIAGGMVTGEGAASGWPSTSSTAWQTQPFPDDPKDSSRH